MKGGYLLWLVAKKAVKARKNVRNNYRLLEFILRRGSIK